ncbi:MAG TPA: hypothetical protein VES64_00845, partial [Allosphingosinicella sp.]|nr:hypothetical protein [Allosphingosinicella sp.]
PAAGFRSDRLEFVVRCNRHGPGIMIGISGLTRPDGFVIRTSYGERRLPVTIHFNDMIADVPVSDPLLEQMAFSRGRFLVYAEGGQALILPAWPELARVIEDCRGQ